MEDIQYTNLFDLNHYIDNIEIPNIIIPGEKNIEKWIIKNDEFPIFFQISNFFLQPEKNYVYINTNNISFNILNSNIIHFLSKINSKIKKNRYIHNYYKKDNFNKHKILKLKFDIEKIIFFFNNMLLKETDSLLEFIMNRKCSAIIQPRLLINHIKKNIDLQYYIFQIKLYTEKIITFENIYNNRECFIKENISEEKCPICYQVFDDNKPGTTKLYCKHEFHFNCINRWFKQKEVNNEDLLCPVCRTKHIINNI